MKKIIFTLFISLLASMLYTNGAYAKNNEGDVRFQLFNNILNNNINGIKAILEDPKTQKKVKLNTSITFDGFKSTFLIVAVFNTNKEIVEYIISKGADVNFLGGVIGGPLHAAAISNKTDIIELLLSKKARIDAKNFIQNTPLMEALSKGNHDAAKYLIGKGADLKCINKMGETSLMCAVISNKIDVVRLVLEQKKVDVNAKDRGKNTALYMAYERRNDAVMKLLAEYGAVDETIPVPQKDNRISATFEEALEGRYSVTSDGVRGYMLEGYQYVFRKDGTGIIDYIENKETDLLFKWRTEDNKLIVDEYNTNGQIRISFSFNYTFEKGELKIQPSDYNREEPLGRVFTLNRL